MNEEKKITAAMITLEFIEEQAAEIKGLAQKAKDAADAYIADLDQRKAALEKQAAEYREQIEAKKKQRKKLAGKINDLSSRGMIDEAAEVDTELEALDKSIATLERKLRIVSTAELRGDAELYKAAKTAHDAAEAERTPYRESIATLQQIVNAEIKRLESIQKELGYAINRDPGQYAASTFTKVNRHYLDLDRLEREAAEKTANERKFADLEKGATRVIFNNTEQLKAVDPEIIKEREAREKQAEEKAAAIRKQNEASNNSAGARSYVLT